MFDFLAKSITRQKILKILFANPDKEFYLSEIARKVKASAGNCQRELKKMVKIGVLNSDKKNNLRIFSVNKKNPVYKETYNIINKTIGVEDEIKRLIKKIPGINFAFIFGSYVKGDFSANSDIDLFIIGDVNENNLIKNLKKTEQNIDREINYHLYSEEDFKNKLKNNSFLKNIVKNRLFLTNNQNEFERLLK